MYKAETVVIYMVGNDMKEDCSFSSEWLGYPSQPQNPYRTL
jgi:hypothetical protein